MQRFWYMFFIVSSLNSMEQKIVEASDEEVVEFKSLSCRIPNPCIMLRDSYDNLRSSSDDKRQRAALFGAASFAALEAPMVTATFFLAPLAANVGQGCLLATLLGLVGVVPVVGGACAGCICLQCLASQEDEKC